MLESIQFPPLNKALSVTTETKCESSSTQADLKDLKLIK